jgi:outer membrane protein assembly factor BamD
MIYKKFFNILFLVVTLVSCAAKSSSRDYLSKYQEAVNRYHAKDYYAALHLFKEVIPMLKGKKEIISAQLYQAYAYFYEKSYKLSAHYFEEFYKTYPRIEQVEEALYMHGYSLYLDKLDIRLDQTRTEKAFRILRSYLSKYPNGVYAEQAKKYSDILKAKLAQKAFDSAKLYYKLGHYQAAVVTLTNFQEEYPDSEYTEEALYLKTNAQYKFAEHSEAKNQLDNFLIVIEYYHELVDTYPDSKYAKESEKVYNIALEKIDKFVK